MNAAVNPNEVHELEASFRATLLDTIGKFRQRKDSLGQVSQFTDAVQAELAKYETKLANMRTNERGQWSGERPYDANWARAKHSHVSQLLDLMETKLRFMAKVVTDRAKESGTVEFNQETL